MHKNVSLLILIVISFSFIGKNSNESEKWLKFYGLETKDFEKVKTDSLGYLNWAPSGLTSEYIKRFSALCYYSPDSVYFLNLNTDGEPEEEVGLIRNEDLAGLRLLYFGPGNFAETALWLDSFNFEIMGFINEKELFYPTIWKYNLKEGTYTELKCQKSYKKLPGQIYRRKSN